MDWNKIAPWNWLRKEQEQVGESLPVRRAQDPFSTLRSEMDRVFDAALGRTGAGFGELGTLVRPSLDIAEGKKAYKVKMEIPGVEKGDVSVTVEEDTLIVRGEKKQETEEREENYHRIERSYGSFQRTLSLPRDADAEHVEAKFKNGLLTIVIPKQEPAASKERSVDIEAS
jgi:HSP20 family protein